MEVFVKPKLTSIGVLGEIMEITPESKKLEKIFAGLETKYSVPDYQRDYSWTTEQVETLWEDIWNSYRHESEYFMGTIVLKTDDKSDDVYDIVDGQQRLATFSILFSVIASIANVFLKGESIFPNVEKSAEAEGVAKKIVEFASQRLRETSEPDNYFLRLNKKDNTTFQNIVRNTDSALSKDDATNIKQNESRLKKTEKVFHNKILEDVNGPDAIGILYKLLVHIVKKLKFITIAVKTDYDAFLLFESLNSKGMDLSVSDLVKNKILMHSGQKELSERLLNNWDDMMRSLEISRISPVEFLRIYWEAIRNHSTTKKELYKQIARYIENNDKSIEKFSEEIKEVAEHISIFAAKELKFPECVHNKDKFLSYCGEINSLKYTLCYPVIMYCYKYRQELSQDISRLSLSFLFRWITVGGYSVSGAKKVFNEVLQKLRENDSTEEDILSCFKRGNDDKIGDRVFRELFSQLKVQENHIAKYILSKLHIYKCKDSIPNYSDVHLEHVIPQQPSKWIQEGVFKPSEGTSISDWVYHIGNMTLLSKPLNQKIQNSVFSEKFIKYKSSSFELTNSIYKEASNGKVWDIDWILKRAKEISRDAPDIWSLEY